MLAEREGGPASGSEPERPERKPEPGGAGQPEPGRKQEAEPGRKAGRETAPAEPVPAEPDAEPPRVSRRFPSVTRDTARPEGGGRAAPGDAPAPARQWPMLAVLGATAVGLLLTALDRFRIGCLIIGVALIAAAVMRRMLPSVGMLAVRSRFTDMVTYGLLGVAITLLALVAEPEPWLTLPFLEEAVRFTVR
ncbi:DUF3017 domain-containing protein [Streptomyces bambusae]|uniref:DUF3017 domain-containing protein n=1 Tax=Streptomyces bambusae TaxID=1550616 RepID=UPI0027DF1CC7|nr:DUF3017 domain-containing protein [Streptomyces bambusae]